MEQLLIASYALIWKFLEALKERYYAAGLIWPELSKWNASIF